MIIVQDQCQGYCPSRASNASTRGCGHRLTIRGSAPGSTSTPWPGPRTTWPGPAALRTATWPLRTRTDVLASLVSTAHFVPRTAAMACGVVTSKRVLAALLPRIDQQRPALQIGGIHVAVLVVTLQRERRAAFGNDGHAAAAMQRQRRICEVLRGASHRGWLGQCSASAKICADKTCADKTCADDGQARHPGERFHGCVSLSTSRAMLQQKCRRSNIVLEIQTVFRKCLHRSRVENTAVFALNSGRAKPARAGTKSAPSLPTG